MPRSVERRSPTSARQAVDFADPWFLTEQSLLVQEDSDIRTIDDLDGKTVGVQKGTTGEALRPGQRQPG